MQTGTADSQPPFIHPDYKLDPSCVGQPGRSSRSHNPLSELTGPVYGHDTMAEHDADLTRNARVNGEPLGERIIVAGRVVDEDDRPVPNTLVEIWQCNAAGRYVHEADQHDAPLDPPISWVPDVA